MRDLEKSRTLSNVSSGLARKPLVQKGFLEDSISSSNLTLMNNRNYTGKAEQHFASFQSVKRIQQDSVLSESQEDMFNQLKHKPGHQKLNSMDAHAKLLKQQ